MKTINYKGRQYKYDAKNSLHDDLLGIWIHELSLNGVKVLSFMTYSNIK